MSAENIDAALREFADSIGLENFKFDEDGFATLILDEEHLVSIIRQEEPLCLLVTATLGLLPANQEHAMQVMKSFLRANHLWQETDGGTLGLNEENALSLSKPVPAEDLTAASFEAALKRFVDLATYWSRKIGSPPASDAPAAPLPLVAESKSDPTLRV